MTRFYSASTGFFYSTDVHGARLITADPTVGQKASGTKPKMIDNPDCTIPLDAVPVSETQYAKLMEAQGAGLVVVTRNGRPAAVNPDEDPALAEVNADALRDKRNRLLAGSDWTQLADAPITDEQKGEAQTYRQRLRDWAEGDTLPGAPEWMEY